MEEILASIRRIIADDQSLPGRARAEEPEPEEPAFGEAGSESHAAEQVVPASPPIIPALEPSPVEMPPAAVQSPEIEVAQAESGPVVASLQPEAETMTMQGSIAAPQYPSPEMPMAEPTIAAPALSDRLEAIHHQAHGAQAGQDITARFGGSNDYFDPPEEYDRPTALTAEAAPLFSATTNSSVASAFNVLAASRLADNSDELLGMAREMIRPLLRSWLDENLPTMVERLVRDEIERVARGGR